MTGLISCTLECNLACKYCFEGNGERKELPDIKYINECFRNSIENLITFVDELYEYNKSNETRIIWHGGEPTLINPELMQIVMEDQVRKQHKNVIWEIQTNGTLINEKYIDIFEKYDVGVGISLDGLKPHHDRYRITKCGMPTFDIILNNIQKLKDAKIRHGILITVTDNNVQDLIEIYEFLAKKELSFSFNALYPTKEEPLAELDTDKFAKAICNLFDKWIVDEENYIMMNTFEQIIEGLLNPERGIP